MLFCVEPVEHKELSPAASSAVRTYFLFVMSQLLTKFDVTARGWFFSVWHYLPPRKWSILSSMYHREWHCI